MNYLFSFQFCLNFGNLCIYRDVSSTLKVAVAAVCFCLIEIKCFANTLHYLFHCYWIWNLLQRNAQKKNSHGKTKKLGSNECLHAIRCIVC